MGKEIKEDKPEGTDKAAQSTIAKYYADLT